MSLLSGVQRQVRTAVLLGLLLTGFLPVSSAIYAQSAAKTDVVVVVDTSTSMQQAEKARHRGALLATKLLADIVPGDLAVARLMDAERDASVNPSRGGLARAARGDSAFTRGLDQYLAPVSGIAMVAPVLRSAQRVFDAHGRPSAMRMVVWIWGGSAEDSDRLQDVARELASTGVMIQPVVFGDGRVPLAQGLGLAPKHVHNAEELIKAITDTFREIVQAPYEVDYIVSQHPSFEMKADVDEAWVVVSGDDSLGEVTIETPNGPRAANYSQERVEGAGAYRVFHVEGPTEGLWSVRVAGGGAARYAVIQRSAVVPVLLEPKTAVVGVPMAVVATVESASDAATVLCEDSPDGLTLEADIEGRKVKLVDDGTNGDAVAHDGHCTATVTFDRMGQIPLTILARSTLVNRSVQEEITVTGMFRVLSGGTVSLNLGTFRAPGESCREFHIPSEQQGVLPLEIVAARGLPAGYSFEIRQSRGSFRIGGQPMPFGQGQPLQLCLIANPSVGSLIARGEHWLDLRLAGSTAADTLVPLYVKWDVQGMPWRQRWRWPMLGLLSVVIFLSWVYGYVHPRRFPRNLAVTFVDQRQELEQQMPQSIAQFSGTGARWYRDARAYLHSSFRLDGSRSGAVAVLVAISTGAQVQPIQGCVLYRETIDGDWEPLPPEGRRAGGGEVYRVGEAGPFFRISSRTG